MPLTSPTLNVMIKAAEKAARSLVRDFGEVEQLQVSRKGPADFVSAADIRAESIIKEELQKARPDYCFLMEESGQTDGKDKDHIWIVDPLDGTTNFLHGAPHWCISIGLEEKGKIIAGVIYDPVKDELFQAEKGQGAFVKNKRLRVSGRDDPMMAMIATGKPNKQGVDDALFYKEYETVGRQMPGLRRFGAAALDLAYIAAGRNDGFWERGLSPWDVAAGYLIIQEAGGFITSIDSTENPVYSRNLVAGNQEIHAKLQGILKSVAK